MALRLDTNIVIVTIVFSALALISVILRFIAVARRNNSFALDDLLILLGLLFTLALGVTTVGGVYLGNLGDHVSLDKNGVPQYGPWIAGFQKVQWFGQLISILAFAFIKLSLVVFYRRLFRGNKFYIITALMLGIISAWGVSFFLAILLQCIPLSDSFLPEPERTGQCINTLPVYNVMATTNLVIDIAILAIPQPYVWKLNMSLRRRIGISVIFLLGAFVIGVSATRIYFFYSVTANPKLEYDVTYNAAPAFYWTNIDVCVAVICASLPSMHSLVAGLSPGHIIRSFASRISLRLSSKRGGSSLHDLEGESRKPSTSSTAGINNVNFANTVSLVDINAETGKQGKLSEEV